MPGAPPLRYRVFYTTPDGLDGRCDIFRHWPIAGDDDVDAIERALIAWFGHSNALVIGWQRFDAIAASGVWKRRGLMCGRSTAPAG